jgi:hypothetical protein
MSTTVLAQIIGPTIAAAAIGFLLHPKFYEKIIKDFEKHEGITYFTGIIVMILGLIVVLNHNIWEWSAAGLVTFFGWSSLVKGATFLVVPNFLFKISHSMLRNKTLIQAAMVIMLVIGSQLIYTGYFA